MKDFIPLALSTTWNYNGIVSVKAALSEIKNFGFNAIEIGYNFSDDKLDELILLIKDMGIKVSSIHNFCPAPDEGMPGRHISDRFRISSPDEKERKKGVYYTKKTIDTATRVSCEVIIIHAGTIDLEKEWIRRLLQLYNERKNSSSKYTALKNRILKSRRARKGPYIEAVVKSLEEIVSYANTCNVKIALETRYYPNEIPDIDEIEYLLNIFANKGVVYWHDVGHGEVNERLGITLHEDFLKRSGDRMFGIHIHGIKGISDHLAPFTGDFDFSKIAPYLQDDLIKVIEAHSRATPDELIKAQKRLIRENLTRLDA